MSPEPRLLKAVVQLVFVAERDGDLTEVALNPVPLSAADWKRLDPETWAKEAAAAVADQIV